MNNENTGGVRCHDADACAMGQLPCPTPKACGCAAAPQEVRLWPEKLGETCMDDGTCHHDCKDKCFRRECCEPLTSALKSGLTMEQWRYPEAGPQAVQAAVPEGWKLAPIKVPDSAFAWVSGGYPAGFKAGDKRDTAVVHERAQLTWEAILDGITAPAHPAEGVPAQCPNINEPRGCWRVACQLGGKCREPERSATQPAAQGMDEERLRNLLCKMVDQLERRWKHRDGNAPGHGHSIPGIWDSDNGELAGKKCAWCEVWQEALEVHAAAQAKQGGA